MLMLAKTKQKAAITKEQHELLQAWPLIPIPLPEHKPVTYFIIDLPKPEYHTQEISNSQELYE